MRKKCHFAGGGVSVAMLVLALGAARASAATLFVDPAGSDGSSCIVSPCRTIQHAVDVAGSGDTVQVAAGTYAENVIVDKEVTLRGAQAGTPRPGREVPLAQESLISSPNSSIDVTGDGAKIEGFAFRNQTSGGTAVAADQITNLALIDNLRDGGDGNLLEVSNAESLVIRGNRVVHTIAPALLVGGNTRASVIEGNEFADGTSSAIEITGGNGTNSEMAIVGNDLSDVARGVVLRPNSVGSVVAIRENVFAGDSLYGILEEATATFDARRNWWGCDGGPNAHGCATLTNSGTPPDASDWLALALSAEPVAAVAGADSALHADLVGSASGTRATKFPDGRAIAFGTSLGEITGSAPTTGGRASATFLSAAAGSAAITATLDSQVARLTVPVTAAPGPPAPPSASAPAATPSEASSKPRVKMVRAKTPVVKGAARVQLECVATAGRCVGLLSVRYRGTDSKQDFELAAGRRGTVVVPLDDLALARFERLGKGSRASAFARTLQVSGSAVVTGRKLRLA